MHKDHAKDADGNYFITPEEYARITDTSLYGVRKWLRLGKLPGKKFGDKWRVQMPKAMEGTNE